MFGLPKIVVCVALLCATTVSAEKKKRDVIGLQPSLPYQWQPANDWGLNGALRIDGYNQNINGNNDQIKQIENYLQSTRGNNILQSIEARANPEWNDLQSGNRYPQSSELTLGSQLGGGEQGLGKQNGQRQSQLSGGLRNTEAVGIIVPNQVLGYNQDLLELGRLQTENIQSSLNLASQINQGDDGIKSGILENERPEQTLRANILQDTWINDESQSANRGGLDVERNIQRNNLRGWPSKTSISGVNREISSQSQIGRSNQLGLNELRGIQEELRGYNNVRQQQLQGGWNGQRRPSTRNWVGSNIGSRQEQRQEANSEGRSNTETSLNSNQQQREGNQNGIAQQQPNIYSYGELSARILKVIQSNPSMLSNMNGLIEQLQNNEDSGNQQVRQLKSLLREMGRYNGNPTSGIRSDNRGQQNQLVRNLLEVVDRSARNQNGWNVQSSRQSESGNQNGWNGPSSRQSLNSNQIGWNGPRTRQGLSSNQDEWNVQSSRQSESGSQNGWNVPTSHQSSSSWRY